MSPILDTSLISQVGESIAAATVIALPDPSKVKAGDTVTLNIDPSPMEVPYRPYSVRGEVYPIGESLFAGGWPITGHPSVTLTDHQPAPEPEPEWKPGTAAEGTVNGETVRGLIGHNDNNDGDVFVYWNETARHVSLTGTVPADARPLVVIDPAAVPSRYDFVATIADESPLHLGEKGREQAVAAAERVVALLAKAGIEVPR